VSSAPAPPKSCRVSRPLGHRQGPFDLSLSVDNLLNREWREVQFATESQLSGEAEPVEEIHFAPGWPFTAQAMLKAHF
jgi:hypothetical protein